MSFAVDPALDMARQVGNALEDEAAQPLAEVQRSAPDGCDYFSELEASISEWAFGYGVAWAMARMRDPLLSSSTTAEIAEHAVRDAWRSFSGQSWTGLMGEDRARRGPVDGDAPQPPGGPPLAAAGPSAPISAAPETGPPEEQSQYGDFMGKVARARPRRPPPGDS
jgi:hypothetical protein